MRICSKIWFTLTLERYNSDTRNAMSLRIWKVMKYSIQDICRFDRLYCISDVYILEHATAQSHSLKPHLTRFSVVNSLISLVELWLTLILQTFDNMICLSFIFPILLWNFSAIYTNDVYTIIARYWRNWGVFGILNKTCCTACTRSLDARLSTVMRLALTGEISVQVLCVTIWLMK